MNINKKFMLSPDILEFQQCPTPMKFLDNLSCGNILEYIIVIYYVRIFDGLQAVTIDQIASS